MTESQRRLAKALRFLELARAEENRDAERFVDFLETAIENGRSVTWLLQAQFAHAAGFDEWYAGQQQAMQADTLMRFFKDVRTFTVKKGPLVVRRMVHITATAVIHFEASAVIRVIRGKPWYRRPLKVTFGDFKAEVLQAYRVQQRRFNAWRRHRQRLREVEPPAVVEDHYYFQEQGFNDRPAIVLVEEYLTRLRPIVEDAEQRFGR